jgi:hypothetical protein
VKFWPSLRHKFVNIFFLFTTHVENCPCINQICTNEDVFVCGYVATIKI